MKRNYAPREDETSNENEIIKERLDKLLSQPERLVLVTNDGVWLPEERHMKVIGAKSLSADILNYSAEHKYHYLNPFESLFCLESKQLIIKYNGLPLSLAEAYHLLILDADDFRKYLVFQNLKRSGYNCLKHTPIDMTNKPTSVGQLADRLGLAATPTTTSTTPTEKSEDGSLFYLNSIHTPMQEILQRLREFGPGNEAEQADPSEDIEITFDVYKRESFAKNKPRKGKRGNPDYHLVVCEHSIHKPPDVKQLLDYGSRLSGKLLYALVNDGDSSICFSQFKPVDSVDLVLI